MNSVLYTHQLKPIAIVNLPPYIRELIEQQGYFLLPIESPPQLTPHTSGTVVRCNSEIERVFISSEVLRRGGHAAEFLFVDEKNVSARFIAKLLEIGATLSPST